MVFQIYFFRIKNVERIGNLLFRYIRKELTCDEERELTSWRYVSAENEKLFQEKTDRRLILSDLGKYLERRDQIFQKIKNQYPGPWENSSIDQTLRFPQVLKKLAIPLVLLLLGIGFLNYRLNREASLDIPGGHYQSILVTMDGIPKTLDDLHRGFLLASAGIEIEKEENGELLYLAPNDTLAARDKYITLYTLRGSQFSLKLPNGTLVRLNAQSTIQFPANFAQDSIKLIIAGEAYVEDMRNKVPLLNILVGHLCIKNQGADMNIRSYPDEPAVITVVQGRALIGIDGAYKSDPKGQDLLLSAHEQVRWVKNSNQELGKPVVLSPGDMADAIAWKMGNTSVSKVNIQTVMQTISKWYDVDIQYEGAKPDQPFSLQMPRSASLFKVLQKLEKQGGHFQLKGRTITVSR